LFVNPDLAFQMGFRSNYPSLVGATVGLFLHANVMHLLGNMVFLAAVGAAVELATGSLRFSIVYFVGGLAGVFAHYLITRHATDPAPLIGASGCIAACAAYYSVRYTSLRVPIAPNMSISVAVVTGIWLLLQLVGAFVKLGDTGGTAFWAHIGGFVAGAVLSLVFRAPDMQQIKLGHEVLAKMNSRGPAAVEFAAKQHLAKHPGDVKALWELADAQSSLGESDSEAGTLVQILDVAPEPDQLESLRRLCKMGRITRLPTLKRLQYADRFQATAPSIGKALLLSVVDGPATDSQRPDAMLALAGLEMADDVSKASEILAGLEKSYPMHPAVDVARKRGWLA